METLKQFIKALETFVLSLRSYVAKGQKEEIEVVFVPPPVPEAPKPVVRVAKAGWETPSTARHSTRVICDNNGLTLEQKNLICAIIMAESGFKIFAKNVNSNTSADYSLCQFNDGPPTGEKWWIGKGKAFESVEDVYANPERQIKIMINALKNNKLHLWAAYNNGSYKKYL